MIIKKSILLYIPCIIFGTLVAVYLNPFSNDYLSYKTFYLFPNYDFRTERIEAGFKLLTLTLQKLDFSYESYWFILCAISLSLKLYILRELHVRMDILILLILLYFSSLLVLHEATQIRAALAISFGYLALYKWSLGYKYILYIIIACTFHYSAIVLLPCIVIFKYLKVNTLSGIITFIIVSVCVPSVIYLGADYLGKLNPLFQLYYENSNEVDTSKVSLTLIFAVLFSIVNLLTVFRENINKELNLHTGLFSLGTIILLTLSFSPVLSVRLYEFFSFSSFIVIAMLFSKKNDYYLSTHGLKYTFFRSLALLMIIVISIHRFIAYFYVNPIMHLN